MVDEKNVGTPDEESNIDQINQFVTSSESSKDVEAEKPEVVEELKAEEKESPKEEKKIEHQNKKPEPEHKKVEHKLAEHKPVHHIKHEVKKVEPKKEEHKKATHEQKKAEPEVKKIEHKPKKIVKPEIKKQEPKKAAKEKQEKPFVKKISNLKTKKSSKEEKMANKEHKEHKKKFKFTKNTLLWLGIGVLAAVLIIALVLILSSGKAHPITAGNETNKSVAAVVNGEPIYLQDVLRQYDSINPMIKSMYSVESVLNKSIDDMLLYQEAKTSGVIITPAEVQLEIDAIKAQNKFTDADLQKALEQQKLTLDDAKSMIERNLMIRKMLNETILKDINITQDQIEKYYLLNTNKFQVPEKVTVQHILILVTPNVTDNESKAKIEKVQSELTATNFCDLVTKYSEDQGSVANCGKYTFAKGDFNNPEFENPSFDLNIGETTIVRTSFGYHLIKKLDSIPATTLSLANVSDQIQTTLHDTEAQTKFDVLIAGLRAKASIINYVTKANPSELDNQTTDVIVPVVKNLDDFAKCITGKGAVFYGASWCTHCNNQKKMFGDSMQYVNYTECAVEGQPTVQTQECTAAGISGYPTWIVNGQSYPGEQTIEGLAKLTGCAAPQ